MGLARARALAVALGAVIAGASLARGEDSAFTFRYAPPDGVRYVEILRTSRLHELEGVEKPAAEIEARTQIEVRRADGGYTITSHPLSLRSEVGGREVRDPIFEVLLAITPVYHVSGDGKLERIQGFDDLGERFGDLLPPAVIEASLNSEVLKQNGVAEWNGRIGNFVGRTVSVGELLRGRTSFPLPEGGTLPCAVETRIGPREPCGQRSCVRIQTTYAGEARTPSAIRAVRGSTQRLIDPETMLVFAESVEQRIEAAREIEGKGEVRSTSIERREYSYEYPE